MIPGWSKGDTLASRNDVSDEVSREGSTRHPHSGEVPCPHGDHSTALHHVHQQGVVDRDIKPANLLLDVDGDVWLTDFGLAMIGTTSS